MCYCLLLSKLCSSKADIWRDYIKSMANRGQSMKPATSATSSSTSTMSTTNNTNNDNNDNDNDIANEANDI